MLNSQRLANVCNGAHFFSLDGMNREDLMRRLDENQNKAIMIVGSDQRGVKRLLRSISKKKTGLRARRLASWSSSASLWMVRN